MSKKLVSLIVLSVFFILTGPAGAQEPDVRHSDPSWRVSYWNNTSMYGSPAVEGTDANLDFSWGAGSPRPGVSADGFSARWIRYIDVSAGMYRFSATTDDGIRVKVDNAVIINAWYDQSARTHTRDAYMEAGHHLITVEYYENAGHAVAQVSWAPVTSGHWRAEYYGNTWLGGPAMFARDEAEINFDWGYGAPISGIPADGFSVRWRRTVHLEPGSYRFTTHTDDGVRLTVNKHLLIDEWRDQSYTEHSGTIWVAGDVPLVMEYYENGGVAAAKLTWARTDGEPDPLPADGIIVDDGGVGFAKNGSPTGWHTAAEGHGGHLTWTRNNDRRRANYNYARWYPELTAGRYEVLVSIPDRFSTTTKARYWVCHRDGYTLQIVNQSANAGSWVSLGTYWFSGAMPHDNVSLSDVTYEPYLSRMIAFDAVKWVPRQ